MLPVVIKIFYEFSFTFKIMAYLTLPYKKGFVRNMPPENITNSNPNFLILQPSNAWSHNWTRTNPC